MTLPLYEVKRFHLNGPDGSQSMLEVKCPRAPCKRKFWVTGAWGHILFDIGKGGEGRAPYYPIGRACPYCFFTSAVPLEIRQFDSNKRSRIVKRKKSRKS